MGARKKVGKISLIFLMCDVITIFALLFCERCNSQCEWCESPKYLILFITDFRRNRDRPLCRIVIFVCLMLGWDQFNGWVLLVTELQLMLSKLLLEMMIYGCEKVRTNLPHLFYYLNVLLSTFILVIAFWTQSLITIYEAWMLNAIASKAFANEINVKQHDNVQVSNFRCFMRSNRAGTQTLVFLFEIQIKSTGTCRHPPTIWKLKKKTRKTSEFHEDFQSRLIKRTCCGPEIKVDAMLLHPCIDLSNFMSWFPPFQSYYGEFNSDKQKRAAYKSHNPKRFRCGFWKAQQLFSGRFPTGCTNNKGRNWFEKRIFRSF